MPTVKFEKYNNSTFWCWRLFDTEGNEVAQGYSWNTREGAVKAFEKMCLILAVGNDHAIWDATDIVKASEPSEPPKRHNESLAERQF